jgi:hypothetical protein
LLADTGDGQIEPAPRIRPHGLDGVRDGYRAMNDRKAIMVMVNRS